MYCFSACDLNSIVYVQPEGTINSENTRYKIQQKYIESMMQLLVQKSTLGYWS